jgi:hypothetical protein
MRIHAGLPPLAQTLAKALRGQATELLRREQAKRDSAELEFPPKCGVD